VVAVQLVDLQVAELAAQVAAHRLTALLALEPQGKATMAEARHPVMPTGPAAAAPVRLEGRHPQMAATAELALALQSLDPQ